jgi:Ca-activated chloride channel homolog
MFENSPALILLLILPLAVIFFVWRHRHYRAALSRVGDADLVRALTLRVHPVRRRLKTLLWLIAVAALIVALARPVWGIGEEVFQAEGIAIVVVLDVSRSMDAQDMLPSRLERARLAARDLFERGRGNQFALVIFAGSPVVQFPLTSDLNTALTFLQSASSRSITHQGTAIEDSLWLALDTLDERIAGQSIIVLLSDGENHEGNPRRAAEEAAERGVAVFTIGYGTPEGAPVPRYDDQGEFIGHVEDGSGNVVQSRLEEDVLQEIAAITGGVYQRASDSGIEIINLLAEIDQMEQTLLESSLEIRRVDRFGIFVLIAVLALTVEMFLPERKKS